MSTLHLIRRGAPLPALPMSVYGVGVAHGQLGVSELEPAADVVVAHARAQQALVLFPRRGGAAHPPTEDDDDGR